MINLFLKAKHWQLFLAIIVIPFIIYMTFIGVVISSMVGNDNPDPGIFLDMFSIFPLVILITGSIQFTWFWSVGVGLNKKIPDGLKLNVHRFKMAFVCVIVGMIAYLYMIYSLIKNIAFATQQDYNPALPGLIFPSVLILMFSVFYIYYFVAKTIRTAELQKDITVGDYIGEFFLIYFFPIGIWFIQPKINKMVQEDSERDELIDIL